MATRTAKTVKVALTERELELLVLCMEDLEGQIEDGDRPNIRPEEAGELYAKIRTAQGKLEI